MKVERPFAYCCAEAGGRVKACDCVNKDHGTAWFDVRDDSTPPVVEEGRREAAIDIICDVQVDYRDDGLASINAGSAAKAADAILALTPVAAQGDEVRDLWSLEQRLTDGEFFSDYDEDLRLLGVFRRHVATLKDSSHEG